MHPPFNYYPCIGGVLYNLNRVVWSSTNSRNFYQIFIGGQTFHLKDCKVDKQFLLEDVLKKKIILGFFATFYISSVWARPCPNLSGTFACPSYVDDWIVKISQSREDNTTTYVFEDPSGQSKTVVADGVKRRFDRSYTISAVCSTKDVLDLSTNNAFSPFKTVALTYYISNDSLVLETINVAKGISVWEGRLICPRQ